MANGKYHIQKRYDFDPLGRWKTDLRMQGMGKDFARGAFFVLRGLAGGSTDYRLVKCNVPPHAKTPEESIEVIETHRTGKVSLNSNATSEARPPRHEEIMELMGTDPDAVADLLVAWETELSKVMPPDFKDWWENEKKEWPLVARLVIESLREREQIAWGMLHDDQMMDGGAQS